MQSSKQQQARQQPQSPTTKLDEMLDSGATRAQEPDDTEAESDVEEVGRGDVEDEDPITLSDNDDQNNLSASDNDEPPTLIPTTAAPRIPSIFTHPSPLLTADHLAHPTATSSLQAATEAECLPFLAGKLGELNSHGIPKLRRDAHRNMLAGSLGEYPPGFVVMDAARPWMVYWALCGMGTLGGIGGGGLEGEGVGEAVTNTFRPCQNPTGGFGGGHGQLSHLAPSFAAVLSLLIVGDEDALESIDRKAMWHWLGSMKQLDGGFTMCEGGEEDIRGAYCAMTLVSLLNLPLELPPEAPARVTDDETFLTGLPEWISRCQTYEGGIAGAPNNEAHGAYAFCALACLCIIGPPAETITKYLDTPTLLAWLSSRQHAPEGGFAGRTNKLVDGCYSHWVGGSWALLHAALLPGVPSAADLWSREGLIRYILCCCQGKKGGLRDKPSKPPDGYHSCYCLAGLAAAQHRYVWREEEGNGVEGDAVAPLSAAWGWSVDDGMPRGVEGLLDEGDVVEPVHPVYTIPFEAVERAREYFGAKIGF